MPLSEKARVEVYLPDLPNRAYQDQGTENGIRKLGNWSKGQSRWPNSRGEKVLQASAEEISGEHQYLALKDMSLQLGVQQGLVARKRCKEGL